MEKDRILGRETMDMYRVIFFFFFFFPMACLKSTSGC